ncbi:MAG: TIGR00159 family protein [Verrucomicrobia bacterium RIFCSPHIGHO2_12_FULL_41_10]|nr:MAG: TIGR00159 family protein [Verrucomicrobia bacterium RIFCSPHIGHO2_12_FULL_41_10]HLB33908.1 diadenylate cyclase CdaA [Chthoniobacterales bacterium]
MSISHHALTELIGFLAEYWTSGLEVLILSSLIYYCYLYLRKTQGARIVIWLALLFVILTFLSQVLDLPVLNWLLRSISVFLAIALVVIFQPELRRALNDLGIHYLFTSALQRREVIEELTEIIFDLSTKNFGALIALEGNISLRSILESGVAIDGILSKELIVTIFHPKTILHDGGVIIHGDHILGASCIFPLSQRDDLDRTIGLRHRAALGLSEESDAIILIVSEETGQVSICHGGVLERNVSEEHFQKRLSQLMIRNDDVSLTTPQLERKTSLTSTGGGSLVSDYAKSLPHTKTTQDKA